MTMTEDTTPLAPAAAGPITELPQGLVPVAPVAPGTTPPTAVATDQGWAGTAPGAELPPRGRLARLVKGPVGDPSWARPALLALLLVTSVLYIWDLAASGWANAFYSAAAQAGSTSWKAFFFGSSDAGNSITVDKTPASLWVMAASVRIFGLNSWSILVPEALMGVATVGVLYATVKRWFGPAAGLLAGATMALTPVAVLMFRFNNPDAMLVLLLVGAAYSVLRALETASTRWLLLAGTLVGFGFLAKMLQAFLVLPVFALVYLLAAPTPVRRRIVQLLGALAAVIVSAGWWVAIVELWPASSRPYIGGSQTNSVLDLVLGYNGLGRLTGNETGSVTGGGGQAGGTSMWGATGWARMFDGDIGGQVAWLIPAAILLLSAGLWLTWGLPRTDRKRAAYLLWGGWLVVTGLVFSFMQGIFHDYYTVALAPAIGALVGMGGVQLWQRRSSFVARAFLAAAVAVTAWWSWRLLARSSDWNSWLGPLVLMVGVVAGLGLLAGGRTSARLTAAAAGAGVFVALAGPTAYALQTASTAHTGSIVTAGPTVAGTNGGRGFGPGPGGQGAPGGQGQGGFGRPQGGQGGFQGTPPGGSQGQGQGQGQGGGFGNRGGAGGGVGGLLEGSTASAELVALLKVDADSYRWVAAAVGSNNAAGYQLASQESVMPIGGFNGSDPSPTLAEFQADVAAGEIHYFIGGGGFGSNGGSDASSAIASWVAANFTAQTVGGVTVYDLTGSATTTPTTTTGTTSI
jgi:4-amino-4-deoxy-L-arabinose transferase-like glycosyltransferase